MNAPATTLQAALQSLPPGALEAIVSANFSTQFLQALGFESDEVPSMILTVVEESIYSNPK